MMHCGCESRLLIVDWRKGAETRITTKSLFGALGTPTHRRGNASIPRGGRLALYRCFDFTPINRFSRVPLLMFWPRWWLVLRPRCRMLKRDKMTGRVFDLRRFPGMWDSLLSSQKGSVASCANIRLSQLKNNMAAHNHGNDTMRLKVCKREVQFNNDAEWIFTNVVSLLRKQKVSMCVCKK